MPEEKEKWKREVSAGGVVYKKENNSVFVLLIMAKGPNYGPPTGVWSYPKGHVEKGETENEAALREVKEETGVTASIEEDLGSVKYFVRWGKENILKFVKYYLMEYQNGDAMPNEEVSEVKWFELSRAEKSISYETDKEVFKRARKILVPPLE